MVLERPVIDERELLLTLDPWGAQGLSRLRRLRRDHVISAGVPLRWGGRPSEDGRERVFCSLNRDAVIAWHRDEPDLATSLGEHARRIETDVLRPWIKACSQQWATQGRDPLLLVELHDDRIEVPTPVWDAAQNVAEVRDRLGTGTDPRTRVLFARIWSMDDVYADVRPEEGSVEDLPALYTKEVLAKGLQLGDALVIRREALGPGRILTTFERALEHEVLVDPLTGRQKIVHLDALLDATPLSEPSGHVRPLRRVA